MDNTENSYITLERVLSFELALVINLVPKDTNWHNTDIKSQMQNLFSLMLV
jgi:hypothetical protein